MKRVKKILCLLLALVMVAGTILPNIKAKAENVETFDKSTIDRVEVFFEGRLIEGDTTTFVEVDELNNVKSIEGYDIRNLNPAVSVYYKGQEQPEEYNGWDAVNVEMRSKFGQTLRFLTNQDTKPYTLGRENKVDVYFFGEYVCSALVSVEPCPIKDIKVIVNKPLYEGRNMVPKYEWVEDHQVQYMVYSVGMIVSRIVVTDIAGNESSFFYLDDLAGMYGGSPEIYTDETYENQWKPGKHTATLKYLGKTCDFEVELKEDPIQNIEVKYHGVVVEDVTEFLDPYKMEFNFTFADGSKETFYIYNEVLGETIAPLFEKYVPENQSIPEGKQYWKGYVCEKEVILETDVMKLSDSPIKSISAVATNDLVANWHSTYDWEEEKEVLDPLCARPQVTVTYQDGSQVTMGYYELQAKFSECDPELSLDNNSLEGIGKRTAKLNFYGHECEFEVNVIENPVDRISVVATKPLVEGFRGDMYDLTFDGGVIITVYYKDGRTFSGTVDEMNYLFYAYPSEEHVNVVIGKNVKKYTFLEKTCEVEFEVIRDDNPIVSIDAKVSDNAVIYKKEDSNTQAWYRYDHLIDVTLTYKDGTKLTGNIDEVNEKLDKQMKVVTQIFVEDDQWSSQWGLGKHQAFVTYKELTTPVEIEVVENPYAKATISNEDNFTVVLEKKDGQVETYKAKRYVSVGSYGSNGTILGYLETDKGILPTETKFAGGLRKDHTNIFYMFVNGVKSNPLQNCQWMEQQAITKVYGDVPEIKLNNSAEELRELVVTEKDYEQLSSQVEGVNAWLEISDKKEELTKEEQDLLNRAAQEMGYENGAVVDLTVYKQFSDSIDPAERQKVPNLNGKISITMAVPEEILASKTDPSTIKMVRIHDGETEVLPCVYDPATKTITFETDKFSTYSMAYESTVAQGETKPGATVQQPSGTNAGKGQDSASPKTGDNNRIFMYFLLCAASLIVLAIDKKKVY